MNACTKACSSFSVNGFSLSGSEVAGKSKNKNKKDCDDDGEAKSEIGTGTREEMLLTQTLMEIRRANS